MHTNHQSQFAHRSTCRNRVSGNGPLRDHRPRVDLLARNAMRREHLRDEGRLSQRLSGSCRAGCRHNLYKHSVDA